MLAFWEDLQLRPDPNHKPGPCRPFPLPSPSSPYTWPLLLQGDAQGWGTCAPVNVPALPVSVVWEPVVAGRAVAVPKYDNCFQGF
jgi:hypothetical protein